MPIKSKNIDTALKLWRPDAPLNDIPRLPPIADLETKVVLKQCIASRVALAELKQCAELIPNQAMLIGTIPLMEAKASSEIENIVTTNDALFRHQSAEANADPATKEALRYRHALLEGFADLASHPLNTRTAEEICTRIKGVDMSVRRIPGTTLTNEKTGHVVYTPPIGEDTIRTLLANWERYIHNQAAGDPLIRMAVAHYQFEAIHPFTDGNGRTGRVLNSLFMIQEELLSLPILYLSRHIIATKADYYRLLMAVTREQAWEPWILYILVGIEETAKWTTAKIAAIRQLATLTTDHVRKTMPKLYSHELVDLIFHQPYSRITHLIEANIAKRETASRYLQRLTEIGVLKERQFGRDKLFIHPKLMHLLTHDSNAVAPYS